jgi:hypothetical protein
MSDIIGQVTIHIDHDEEKHQIIDCDVSIHGRKCPLELVGTGYLQLIQLFCYVLLFKPGILLVDEPDIHLHPSIQENLPLVLARVARERSLRILLTTHSPFIVRGAPVSANVYWVSDGTVTSSSRSEVELNLGWGTFGKKIIVVSEDTKLPLLRKLISQWKNIENFVGFWPGTGYKTLPTPKVARAISDALGNKFKILVHRDRDSLTDTEAEVLVKQYADEGIDLWLPKFGDIEAYFCLVPFIAELTNCSLLEAENCIREVLRKRSADIANQFSNQRHTHNQQLYPAGGSPINEQVWQELQNRPLKGASGKLIFAGLKNEIKKDKFSEESIESHIIKMELASDLRERILEIIDKE